jgi:hypothetical protein
MDAAMKIPTRWFRATAWAFLLAAAIFLWPRPTPAADPTLLFSYEALPVAQVVLPKAKSAPYADKALLAEAVARELVPAILDAMKLDPTRAKTDVAPGGYLLATEPALYTVMQLTHTDARRLAAALGYVLRQGSVLVSDCADPAGTAAFASVRFDRAPDAALAQRFFEHAAKIEKGLGGGFSVTGGAMLFINPAGADGKPMSGLGGEAFVAALTRASQGFPGARLAASGKCRAYLVENDWAKAANGEEFAAQLGPGGGLMLLRLKHTVMVESYASRYGWR